VTHLHLTTSIAAPADLCCALVLNVDVQRSLGEGMDAVAGVTSGSLGLGDTVTWRARHFGIVWHMTSEIVAIERPKCFRDEMQRAPFAYWRHLHEFVQLRDGTVMTDDIVFAPPLGTAGRIADTLVLGTYMRRLLSRRNRDLKLLAESRVAA